MSSILDTLGVDWDADERTIKRAYAKLIKEFRPDSHPAEFARIRAAYENALENYLNRERWNANEELEQGDEIADAELQAEQHRLAEFEASYTEPESVVIAPYQRLPRAFEPDQQAHTQLEQSAQAELESTNEPPPYRRTPSEALPSAEDEETLEEFDYPEIQYEYSADEFIATLSGEYEFQGNDKLINEHLATLASFNLPAQEPDALACFEQQIISMDTMSLDQRMDYEDSLCHWLLYSQQPSLLVFLAAYKRFSWSDYHLNNIRQHFGSQAEVRFNQLLNLANFYNEIIESDSALLKDETKSKWEFLRLKTHVDALDRKAKLARWKEDCLNADLPGLQGYFEEYIEKRFQIFAIDIFFAITMAGMFWWIASHPDISKDISIWMLLGAMATIVPISLLLTVGIRSVHDAIQAKPETKVCKTLNWFKNPFRALVALAGIFLLNTIIFSALENMGVIYLVITTLLILSIPFFLIYGVLAKFEKLIANIWWFLIDTILLLERTAAEITPNPYLQFMMRIVLYVAVPVLLIKEYVPEMLAFAKKILASRTASILLMAVALFAVIMAFVIYKDVAEQKERISADRQVLQEQAYKAMLGKAQHLPKKETPIQETPSKMSGLKGEALKQKQIDGVYDALTDLAKAKKQAEATKNATHEKP